MKTRTGYLIKRNQTYYACWTVNGKKFMRTTRTANRKDARDFLDNLMSPFRLVDEVKTLEHVAGEIQGRHAEIARIEDTRNPPVTVADAWTAYVGSTKRPDSGPATLQQYAFQFDAFARWIAAEHKEISTLRDVSKDIAQAYASHLQRKGVSAGTFTKHIRLLHLVFDVLSRPARLTVNPWTKDNITRRKARPHSRRELTVEELHKVCADASGELRPLLALGIYTGLRLGDCCTLRWCEIDRALGIIRRVPNKTARKGTPVTIPIHSTLRGILDEIPKLKRGDFVLPELARLYMTGRRYLITDRIQSHFATCGIATVKPGTGEHKGADGKWVKSGKRAVVEVGFHSLRHSFVSICRAANVPLSVVESLVGHSNPAMTRHYTHASAEAAGAAVSALPDVTGKPRPVLPAARPAAIPDMIARSAVRSLVEKLTAENTAAVKADLLALLATP